MEGGALSRVWNTTFCLEGYLRLKKGFQLGMFALPLCEVYVTLHLDQSDNVRHN